jgi:beta-glucosidase-like glycosyl hydrolase
LGIVFYSHRVSYPNVLSAQVLPQQLKDLAVSRLQEVASRVSSFENVKKHPILEKITQQQIQDNINYLKAKDQSNLWQEFLEFNYALDTTRGQRLLDAVPEFRPYA